MQRWLLMAHVIASFCSTTLAARYDANWESLMKRPLPKWFDEAKVGLFIHWGVFSVPSYKNEWYWWNLDGRNPDPDTVAFHNRTYGPDFKYAEFMPSFTAALWQPAQWASLFKDARPRPGKEIEVFAASHTLTDSGFSDPLFCI